MRLAFVQNTWKLPRTFTIRFVKQVPRPEDWQGPQTTCDHELGLSVEMRLNWYEKNGCQPILNLRSVRVSPPSFKNWYCCTPRRSNSKILTTQKVSPKDQPSTSTIAWLWWNLRILFVRMEVETSSSSASRGKIVRPPWRLQCRSYMARHWRKSWPFASGNPDSQWDAIMDHLKTFKCYPPHCGGEIKQSTFYGIFGRISLVIVHCVGWSHIIFVQQPLRCMFQIFWGEVLKIILWVLECWANPPVFVMFTPPQKWTNVPWKGTMWKGHFIFQASVFRG